MRKRLAAFVAAFALALGLGLAVSSPAQAAWSQCQGGYMCFWSNNGGTGSFYAVDRDVIMQEWGWRLPTMNNNSESWWNRTGTNIIVFDANNCAYSSWHRTLNGNQTNGAGSDWRNRISSVGYRSRIDYPCSN